MSKEVWETLLQQYTLTRPNTLLPSYALYSSASHHEYRGMIKTNATLLIIPRQEIIVRTRKTQFHGSRCPLHVRCRALSAYNAIMHGE